MIGLNLGTTNCKAVLLDADGRVVAAASDGYRLQVPHPRAAEPDVRHVWAAAQKVLRAVAEAAPTPPAGICFSGAMHSLFPVADEAGAPLSNAMTWADARATADKGMMYGLGMQHNRAHFARAAMEGVANCLADVWDALYGSETSNEAVRITGGITRTPLWVQILADMLGVPLMALEVADASATGAALLGMHALGLIGPDQMAATVEPGPIYNPDLRRHQFYKQHHREYRALRRGMAAMGETLDNLKESFL